MVVTLGSLVIRVMLILVEFTIKKTVNCSVPSESLSSVIFILKHPFELLLTVVSASLSRWKSLPAKKKTYDKTYKHTNKYSILIIFKCIYYISMQNSRVAILHVHATVQDTYDGSYDISTRCEIWIEHDLKGSSWAKTGGKLISQQNEILLLFNPLIAIHKKRYR